MNEARTEQIQRIMRDHNVSEATAVYVADAEVDIEKAKAAMAEKRARLHRIAIEEADIEEDEDYADSGSLSEDEERALSEWPR